MRGAAELQDVQDDPPSCQVLSLQRGCCFFRSQNAEVDLFLQNKPGHDGEKPVQFVIIAGQCSPPEQPLEFGCVVVGRE